MSKKTKKVRATKPGRTPRDRSHLPPKEKRVPPSVWSRKVNEVVPPRLPLAVGELRHGDAPRWEQLKVDLYALAQFVEAYGTVLDRIRSAQLPDPSGSTFTWCFTHETDRPHTLELRGWEGAPVPCPALTTWVGAKDMPGEAAVHPNAARMHEAQLAKLLGRVHRVVEDLRYLGLVYVPRRPKASDRLALERVNARQEPGCAACARVGRWTAPRGGPTTVAGVLDEEMLLCRWHCDATRAKGALPSDDETRQHHDPTVAKVRLKVSPTEHVEVPS